MRHPDPFFANILSRLAATMPDQIANALVRIGRVAPLSAIYRETRQLCQADGRKLTTEFEATVRNALQSHAGCGRFLFVHVRRGVWGLVGGLASEAHANAVIVGETPNVS
jgi:hypothetical protein